MYYKNASAVCMVYDISSGESFDSLQKWKKDADENRPDTSIMVVVGNKCDLAAKEEVKMKDAIEYAKKNKTLLA